MSESNGQIGFEQVGLAALLRNNRLIVPVNQRDYAWEEKEVTTLFKDLERAISAGTSSYFLGTIVTIPRGGLLEVVDGQQRLATTAIFLSAMRDYTATKVPLLAESIEKFLTDIDRDALDRVPTLRLNLDDNDFYRARLTKAPHQPPPSKASHKLLDQAFEQARTRVQMIVSGLDEKDHGPRITK